MQFRISSLLYVFALLAAALATFGGWGIVAAGSVVTYWLYAFSFPPGTRLVLLTVTATLLVGFLLLIPAVTTTRYWSRSNACHNNIKSVGLALEYYDELHGSLPQPAEAVGGEQVHSWRTEILPYMECESIYEQLKLDEPWNSRSNKLLTDAEIDILRCPSCPAEMSGLTNYVSVVGARTFYPSSEVKALKDCVDDPATTLLIVERQPATPWAKPEDLSFDDVIELLTANVDPDTNGGHILDYGFFYKEFGVRHAVMANGEALMLYCPLPVETATAILTIDGGEIVERSQLTGGLRIIDWARCASLALFIVLALVPLGPFVRHLKTSRAKPSE